MAYLLTYAFTATFGFIVFDVHYQILKRTTKRDYLYCAIRALLTSLVVTIPVGIMIMIFTSCIFGG